MSTEPSDNDEREAQALKRMLRTPPKPHPEPSPYG